MCYSAQVIQMARKLSRQLGIRLDYDEVEKLFFRRLDDPGLIISRGFEANFDDPGTDQERRIRGAIEEHRARVASKMERIFPFVYAGVIVKKDGQNLLTPMRYFCRPAGKPAFLDRKFPGLYNARRDNLEKFWGEQFGSHHAVLVVGSFYENVKRHTMEHRELLDGEREENIVLQFKPEPAQTMYIACLWSHWTDPKEPGLRGFAAITDEPPADIATAGHDRCIINLKPEHVEAWLTPENRSAAELQSMLSDRAIPVFQHEILSAA